MNGLTLKTLREAIETLKTAKRFQQSKTKLYVSELVQAEQYFLGEDVAQPRDPRVVLAAVGYKL